MRQTLVRRWVGILLVGSLVAVGWWGPRAGAWLVVTDSFAHAEIALVLGGNPTQRALAARDLYRQGRVEQILVLPEPPSPTQDELVKLGLVDPTLPTWAEQILRTSGVPPSQIAVLPTHGDGTIEEALMVKRFLRGHFPRTLVVVTSKSAARRARFVFRQVLRHEPVHILVYSTPYDPFEPYRWWTHQRTTLTVVTEYEKFVVNALALAWSH